jgi:polyhydroxybutyrate depolymerase
MFLLGCSSGASTPPIADASPTDSSVAVEVGADVNTSTDVVGSSDVRAMGDVSEATAALIMGRPYRSFAPSIYNGSTALPLVIVLHGFGANGQGQSLYLGFSSLYEQRGFLLATPDGTLNTTGQRFWNATDACCNFGNAPVDDVAYITAIIDDMSARYRVDPQRVFLVGHSNGGFMSHRMACDRANRIAAIVSLAGAQFANLSRCTPSEPVSVLQVHGTLDETIPYMGGTITGTMFRIPSAQTTVTNWSTLNRCGAFSESAMRRDFVADINGAETVLGEHTACAPGGAAALWTLTDGRHIPALNAEWGEAVYDWLLAHPKPAR